MRVTKDMIKFANEKDLRELTGIVYMIINNLNGKKYIGHTKLTFFIRYNRMGSIGVFGRGVRNSMKCHGHECFSVKILKSGIESEEERENLEIKYIKEYDTIYPKGYNFLPGGKIKGQKAHEDTKRELSERQSKNTYKLKNKEGEIFEFNNLFKFAKEHNLPSYWNIYNVIKGISKSYKGFYLQETEIDTPSRKDFVKIVKDKNGNLIKIHNVRKFCKEHGYILSSFYGLLQGRVKSLYGYTVVIGSKKSNNIKMEYKNIILTKDEKDYPVLDIYEFSLKYNIRVGRIYNLARGDRKSSNGFKLKSCDLLQIR